MQCFPGVQVLEDSKGLELRSAAYYTRHPSGLYTGSKPGKGKGLPDEEQSIHKVYVAIVWRTIILPTISSCKTCYSFVASVIGHNLPYGEPRYLILYACLHVYIYAYTVCTHVTKASGSWACPKHQLLQGADWVAEAPHCHVCCL